MVLVIKLTAIAFDYQDGGLPANPRGAPQQPWVADHRLDKLPGVIEFLSYLFYPGNVLAGPFVPAADYFAFIRRSGPWARSAPRLPSPLLPTLRCLAAAVVCLALHMTLRRRRPPAPAALPSLVSLGRSPAAALESPSASAPAWADPRPVRAPVRSFRTPSSWMRPGSLATGW